MSPIIRNFQLLFTCPKAQDSLFAIAAFTVAGGLDAFYWFGWFLCL